MKLETLLSSASRPSREGSQRFYPNWTVRVLLAIAGAVLISFGAGAAFWASGFGETIVDELRASFSPSSIARQLEPTDLPVISIQMSLPEAEQLEKKRADAVELGLLVQDDSEFVTGNLRIDGQVLPVRVRLKGDHVDHLSKDKPSLRIEVRGDGDVFGMRRFSLQHPSTRRYLNEFAYLAHLRQEGVLAPRYSFVDLVVNGERRGIFALEEHFSKELLESQLRREGVIVRFDETAFWEWQLDRGRLSGDLENVFSLIFPIDEIVAPVDSFRSGSVDRSATLSAQRDLATSLLQGVIEGRIAPSDAYDADLLGKFAATNDLWDAPHATLWHNRRLYFNPVTAKLEPIAFDGEPVIGFGSTRRTLVDYGVEEDFEIASSYVRSLRRISEPDYLESIREQLEPELAAAAESLQGEFGSLNVAWDKLLERRDLFAASLQIDRPIIALEEASAGAGPDIVAVRNTLLLPVKIVGVSSANSTTMIPLPDGPLSLAPRSANVFVETHRVELPASVANGPYTVYVEVPGSDNPVRVATVQSSPTAVNGNPAQPSTVSEALAQHPFLELDNRGDLAVKPGTWNVEGDLILPEGAGLTAGPGVTLLFEDDAILYSTGSLRLMGSESSRVTIGPQTGSWGGIVVVGAEQVSTVSFATITSTNGIARGGWAPTGGITFYQSEVSLSDCVIAGSEAEDALNIIQSAFDITRCEFNNNVSDAFDGDFVSGNIVSSRFVSTGGDAIDFSGSRVHIEDVEARSVGDKGLSAGENSDVTINGFTVVDPGVGIASKDLSRVSGSGVQVHDARVTALAAYLKKSEFGTGEMRLSSFSATGPAPRFLVQDGSLVAIDGARQKTRRLTSDELRELGVTGG